jgi:hypothetical protein
LRISLELLLHRCTRDHPPGSLGADYTIASQRCARPGGTECLEGFPAAFHAPQVEQLAREVAIHQGDRFAGLRYSCSALESPCNPEVALERVERAIHVSVLT